MNNIKFSIKYFFITTKLSFYYYLGGVLILFFAIISGFLTYQHLLKEQEEILETECLQLSVNLEEVISRINDFIHILGKQIATENTNEISKVAKIIKSKSDESFNSNVLNMITFGWVSEDKYLLVDRQIGILPKPIDFTIRSYVNECLNTPWTIFFSKPAIGIPEGLWEIHGGMGVANDLGKVIGMVVFGLNIAELNSKMQQLISKKKVNFIILDEDFNIVLRSYENTLDPKSPFFITNLKDRLSILETEGMLTSPVLYNNISYTYFKKLDGYPYLVLMGYDVRIFNQNFLTIFAPYILGVTIIILALVSFLAFVQRRFRNTVIASQFAKDLFLVCLKEEKTQALNRLIEYTGIVEKYLNGEIAIGLNSERLNQLVSKIHHLAKNLSTEITETMTLSLIDINQTLKECVLISIQDALMKGVRIKLKHQTVPLLNINEMRFKQIILGIISFCIDLTQRGGLVVISSKLVEEGNQKKLRLTFFDNGLSLSEQDIYRLQKKFDFQKQIYEEFKLGFLAVQKLVADIGGECILQSFSDKGKVIKVTFNYDDVQSKQIVDYHNVVELKKKPCNNL